MAKEPNEHDDLNEFEAALASLAPRSDRLHRDRLMFLAGQASVEAGPTGRADGSIESVTPAAAPRISRRRRWVELALGGMTALAASLLVALVVRPTQVVERIVEVPAVSPQAAPVAPVPPARRLAASSDEVPSLRPPVAVSRDGWLAMFLTPASPDASAEGTSHRQLRDLAFSLGLDAWPSPGRAVVAEDRGVSPTGPRTERELLKDLLDQFETPRPEGRSGLPESTSQPGAKS